MNTAPIVLFAYNRPNHLRKVLDALSRNRLADRSDLFVYCDGAKKGASEQEKKAVADCRFIAKQAKGFKSLMVVERENNYGLADNIIGSVTEIVNQYGRVITLEDDVITSEGFLQYMNDALEVYKDDEQVMHITGFMWHYHGWLPSTFFYTVPECGGGWATWKRAWDHFTYDVEPLYNYWKNDWTRFNIWGGETLQRQLENNYKGTLKTWFIRWYSVVRKMGGMTLYPNHSLTTNIGFDGSGTNCYNNKHNNPFYWPKLAETIPVKRQTIKENAWARYQIYCSQQGHFYSKRNRKHILYYFRQLYIHSRK